MTAGISIIGFIIPIIGAFISIGILIMIIVVAIKGVKGHGGKISDGENNSTNVKQTSEEIKASAEEINQKIKNIFANLAAAQNSSAQTTEQKETKTEVKESRCKNCGATLAEDKNGKLHCPYCQSKYF